jgi:hypothetical protein
VTRLLSPLSKSEETEATRAEEVKAGSLATRPVCNAASILMLLRYMNQHVENIGLKEIVKTS